MDVTKMKNDEEPKTPPVLLSRYRSRMYTDDNDIATTRVHNDNVRKLTLTRAPSKSRFFVRPEPEVETEAVQEPTRPNININNTK